MKSHFTLMICILSALLISCQKELPLPDIASGPGRPAETGSLDLNIQLQLRIDEVSNRLKSAEDLEDFSVSVFSADGSEVLAFENVSDIPDTIELEIGNYYIEAHSENDVPAAFENPWYFGASDVFAISSNSHSSVELTCTLANTIVSVEYSESTRNSFTAYNTTVASSLDSLVFAEGETRWGFFRPLPLNIRVVLSYTEPDGTDAAKVLSGSIPDPKANRHYQIVVNASPEAGTAGFLVLLDSSEVATEIVQIADSAPAPQAGDLAYGDLLISEIMYNPSVLSDTEGEWFEIYNNSGQAVNLQGLLLVRDDLNSHVIVDSIDLLPGGYYVFQRSGAATPASNSYDFGSAILLPNTGAILSIYDGGTMSEPGDLIFSVNYGDTGFPDGSGASICLDPSLMNPADAVLGSTWCVSTSVFGAGDLGTPGLVNDSCQ